MKRCSLGVLLALLPAALAAAPSGAAPSPTELVRLLGDPSFEARRDAAERLAALGRSAVPALEAGLKAADPELRHRCEELLPMARRTDDEIEVDAFVADTTGKRAPSGWAAFREASGDSKDARRLFSDLYRTDRSLLEKLAKDPKSVGAELTTRCQHLQTRPWAPGQMKPGEPAGLLLAAALAPPSDNRNFWALTNACNRTEVATLLGGNAAARHLLGRALAPRARDENMITNVVPLAVRYGMTEFCKDTLQPMVRDLAGKVKPEDWRFYNVAYSAQQLGMYDLLENKIKPELRQAALNASRDTSDVYRLGQIVNISQALGMRESIEEFVRPAALRMLRSAADKPTDFSIFYQARYMSQILKLEEAFDHIVKPGVCRHMAEQCAKATDVNQIQQLVYLAQALNADSVFEGALRPAARRLILADLEQPDDFNRLSRSAQIASQVRLTDLMDNTLKPVVRRQAAPLKDQPPDANRINQVYQLAQTLGMKDVIDDSVKPAFLRLCAASRKPEPGTFSGMLNLARALKIKEAIPMALQGASAKDIQAWERAAALFFIGEVGTKEDIARLEPLLKDTSGCGDCGINSTTLHAEIRDVALGVMVHKSGQSLAEYGFPYFQIVALADPFQSAPCFMGFPGNSERDAALKKWQAYQASRKK
jgi:HEAT repeat protein